MPSGNQTFIDDEFLDDVDIDTIYEFALVVYILKKSNMVGVCPWRIDRVVSGTRLSENKNARAILHKTLESLIGKGKCKIYPIQKDKKDRMVKGYLWYKSVMFYKLYKGKASPDQKLHASKCLAKLKASELFGSDFVDEVINLYKVKYSIDLPIIESLKA